jgi:hypothetical protein
MLSAQEAENSKSLAFTITGKVDGLMPGDTLCFERIILPMWQFEPAFNYVVENQGGFTYKCAHPHSQYYVMTYKSVSGIEPATDVRGLLLFIKEGDLTIDGTVDYIYYSKVTGGIFDDTYLQKALALDKKLGMQRAAFSKISRDFYASGDTLQAKDAIKKFNYFSSDHETEFAELSQLNKEFIEHSPSSEWTIIQYLSFVMYRPIEETQAAYDTMNQEARESYYGKQLKQQMDKVLKLTSGNDAPEFNLTTLDGNNISSKDCAGSYLLIYHWGLCPGSILNDTNFTEFYNKYKDHLKMIGITDNIATIRSLYEETKPDDEMMGAKLKPILEKMIAHPWIEVEDKGDNHQLLEDFLILGYPYFVFISPDGKMIAKGFYDTFDKAKETLQAAFDNP